MCPAFPREDWRGRPIDSTKGKAAQWSSKDQVHGHISDLASSHLVVKLAKLSGITENQAGNQLGTPGGGKNFLREAQNL